LRNFPAAIRAAGKSAQTAADWLCGVKIDRAFHVSPAGKARIFLRCKFARFATCALWTAAVFYPVPASFGSLPLGKSAGKHRSGRLIFPKRKFTSLRLSDRKFYTVKINLVFRLSAVFAFAATLDAADYCFSYSGNFDWERGDAWHSD